MDSPTQKALSGEALSFPHSQRGPLESYLPSIANSPQAINDNGPKRAFVTLTWAASLDAQIAAAPGTRTVLSGPQSKAMTHYLRTRHDAIMVGATTLLVDNPSLNCRLAEDDGSVASLDKQPIPVILDPSGRWDMTKHEKVWQNALQGRGKKPIWVVSDKVYTGLEGSTRSRLQNEGLLLSCGDYTGPENGVQWDVVLDGLYHMGIRSIMIEGGAKVITDLLKRKNQDYIDSVIVTVAPTFLGAGGVSVVPERSDSGDATARLKDVTLLPLGEDIVMAGRL